MLVSVALTFLHRRRRSRDMVRERMQRDGWASKTAQLEGSQITELDGRQLSCTAGHLNELEGHEKSPIYEIGSHENGDRAELPAHKHWTRRFTNEPSYNLNG